MALANVAWILATNGLRVLAVDWDLESPGLHRYFHPFLVDKQLRTSPGVIDAVRDYAAGTARIERYVCPLRGYEFPGSGLLELMPAGRQVSAYSTSVSAFNWYDFYERLGGWSFVDAFAADMRERYDYVLIDSRAGLSDHAGICTVQLPEAVVCCFTMSTQSIEGAAAAATSIVEQSAAAGRRVRIVPAAMRVEEGEPRGLERGREYARQRFAGAVLELPHRVFYAYEEVLAAFGDPPGEAGSLLAAYERLAGELTGEPCTLVAPEQSARRRWLAAYERRTATEPVEVATVEAARERAVTLRQRGDLTGARGLIEDALDRAERQLGPRHPATLACALEFAVVLSESGTHEEAIARASRVLAAYQEIDGGGHLCSLLAANDLAVILIRSGQPLPARSLVEEAAGRLPAALTPTHPYPVLAMSNLAGVRFAEGSTDEARLLDEECHRRLEALLGEDHPSVIALSLNRALTALDTGEDDGAQADAILRRALRVLGEDHPVTLAARTGSRIFHILEPPPT
jgi:MinD-like ATPase involved in chromosome partitioning or flagellar assembly